MNELITDLFGMSILIVDDAPEDLDLLNALLVNYKRKLANNGKKALKIVMSKNPPDLILLDIMMPDLSGIEVAKVIKNTYSVKDIPIIFTTAKGDEETILSGFELGAVDYVTKPFNELELLARINTHLELKLKSELLLESNIILEEKIKERTKDLVEANRKILKFSDSKNKFLRLISHEIRTPLNGICGFSSLLHNQLQETEYFTYTDNLMKSVERLENFSKVALLITEIQSYGTDIKKERVSIKMLAESVVKKLKKQISAKNIKIIIDIDSAFPDLMLKENIFEICLTNIIDNAIKYSPESSKINIGVELDGDKFSISISDEGQGFSKYIEDNLFDLFTSDFINPDQTLGLGLSVSKMIMQAHGGKIEFGKNSPSGLIVKLII